MNEAMPRTPFSTALSGSARETELRLRNIFSGPKKRPPAALLILTLAACVLCGNLVSCRTAEEGRKSPGTSQNGALPPPQEMERLSVQELKPDLNHNGIPEEIRLENEYGWDEVRFYENGQLLVRENSGVYLYALDGKDYVFSYTVDVHQGSYKYYYHFYSIDSTSGYTVNAGRNSISFDLAFGAPFHKGFEPEAIAAFVEEVNERFAHSVRLSVRDGELAAETGTAETLDLLDAFPEIFTRNPDKSMEENLRDFQAAMLAAYPPVDSLETADVLPFDQPLEMTFASGAGGWSTEITLEPDGSFTGLFVDADMGDSGEGYPGGTRYVCQFHGSFGEFVQRTSASWSMILEELTLDTELPVGEMEFADGVRCISSEAYGFEGQDGKSLQPGARFILYTPEAQGHEPGTELYGAYEFWSWWIDRREFRSAADTLGCWGLHNLEADTGFFT